MSMTTDQRELLHDVLAGQMKNASHERIDQYVDAIEASGVLAPAHEGDDTPLPRGALAAINHPLTQDAFREQLWRAWNEGWDNAFGDPYWSAPEDRSNPYRKAGR